MKNYFLVIVWVMLTVVSLFGTPLSAAEKKLNIAMIQWRGETEACRGFKDGLKDLGYSVKYVTMNAGQNRKELGRLLRNELDPNINSFDYIYTFGTTVSKATKFIVKNRVPQVFTIVVAPVEAGIVKRMEDTGGNISGAIHKIPISVQLKAALKLFQFKTLGFLFNPREKNSLIQRQWVYDVAKILNIEVIDLRSPPAFDTLKRNLQRLIDKSIVVDAVFMPFDTYIFTNDKLIGDKLRVAKVKSIGSIKRFIDNGALVGVVPNYYRVGKSAAKVVDRHQKGEKLQIIPVYLPEEPILVINKTTADVLKITIPETLLKKAVIVE